MSSRLRRPGAGADGILRRIVRSCVVLGKKDARRKNGLANRLVPIGVGVTRKIRTTQLLGRTRAPRRLPSAQRRQRPSGAVGPASGAVRRSGGSRLRASASLTLVRQQLDEAGEQ